MKSSFLLNSILVATLLLLSGIEAECRILIGEKVVVGEESGEEIFTIADEIEITGRINNEFIGIGRKIDASSDIRGDFVGIGLNVFFSGLAESDIYLLGNMLDVEGTVMGSFSSLGRSVHAKGNIDGNLRVIAEDIHLKCSVKGRTILWGKNITLKGDFNDVVIYGNNIHLAPGTVIAGNLTYNTTEKKRLSHVDIHGDIKWNKPFTDRAREKIPIRGLARIYTFFSLLLPILLTLWIFPNLFKQTADIAGRKYISCFITGSLFIISTLIALPVIFITIVGAPLGLIITSLFFSLIYISRVFPAIFIGRKILFKMPGDRTITWVLATFIGIFLFTTVSIHPTAKILLNILSIPAGFGALFKGRINLLRRLKKEQIL